MDDSLSRDIFGEMKTTRPGRKKTGQNLADGRRRTTRKPGKNSRNAVVRSQNYSDCRPLTADFPQTRKVFANCFSLNSEIDLQNSGNASVSVGVSVSEFHKRWQPQ
jgi:hypothetical protein